MACDVSWTAHARSDVDRIVGYVARDLASPQTALEHWETFWAAAEELSGTPELHAVSTQPSLAARNLRVRFVKNYVMLYRYDGQSVLVFRVFHTRQDYATKIAGLGDS